MGLKIVLSEGMLLEKLGAWFEKKAEKSNFYKWFICQWCMPSMQSFTAHFFAFALGIIPLEFNLHVAIRWLLVIMASSFISGNLWNLYETVNRIKDKNEVEKDTLISINSLADILIENNIEEYDKDEEQHFGDQIVFNSKHN